ncbi:hypothetical protein Ciccas_010960, partial [Cichlidogyrus casuarinus]
GFDCIAESKETKCLPSFVLVDCVDCDLETRHAPTVDWVSKKPPTSCAPAIRLKPSVVSTQHYYCLHSEGIHLISLDWAPFVFKTLENIHLTRRSCKYLDEGREQSLTSFPSTVELLFSNKQLATATNAPSPALNLVACLESSSEPIRLQPDDLQQAQKDLSVSLLCVARGTAGLKFFKIGIGKELEKQKLNASLVKQPGPRMKELDLTPKPKTQAHETGIALKIKNLLTSTDKIKLPQLATSDPDETVNEEHFLKVFNVAVKEMQQARLDRLSSARMCIDEYMKKIQNIFASQAQGAQQLLLSQKGLKDTAHKLADKQAMLAERQSALDCRVNRLARVVASQSGSLSSAEISMKHDLEEIVRRNNELYKQWLKRLQASEAELSNLLKQKSRARPSFRPTLTSRNAVASDTQVVISPALQEQLRLQTEEISNLVKTVELLKVHTASTLAANA